MEPQDFERRRFPVEPSRYDLAVVLWRIPSERGVIPKRKIPVFIRPLLVHRHPIDSALHMAVAEPAASEEICEMRFSGKRAGSRAKRGLQAKPWTHTTFRVRFVLGGPPAGNCFGHFDVTRPRVSRTGLRRVDTKVHSQVQIDQL